MEKQNADGTIAQVRVTADWTIASYDIEMNDGSMTTILMERLAKTMLGLVVASLAGYYSGCQYTEKKTRATSCKKKFATIVEPTDEV